MDIEKEKETVIRTTEEMLASVPYRYALINLFIHPRYGLFLAMRGGWWLRGFLVLLLIGALGGGLKAFSILPGLLSDAREVVLFLADHLGDLRLQDGRISWKEPVEFPLTGHLSRLRVDVWNEDSAGSRKQLLRGPEKSGILVLSDRVDYWSGAVPGGDDLHAVSILPPKMIAMLEQNSRNSLPPGSFTKQQLLDYVQMVCLLLFPVLALVYCLAMLGTTLLFGLFFSLLLQLRSQGGKFRNAAGMGLHCCMAPFLTTVIYHVFVPNLGRFENVFGIVFLVYVLFMIVEDRWFRADEKQIWGL